MKRTLLIARREYVAYAKTVGFWLSLLAFPMFAVLGGGIPLLIRSAEPIKVVTVIEDGPAATGLAAEVRAALQEEKDRLAERVQEAAQKGQAAAGRAAASISGPKMRLIDAPPALTVAAPGAAREAALREVLDKDASKDRRVDAVVFLSRVDGKPQAQVWTARAMDNDVADFVRNALRTGYRDQALTAAGVAPSLVEQIESFKPEVKALSLIHI